MNRKNLLYIVLVLVLAAVAFWLMSNRNETSTIEDRREHYDFAVSDTAAIDKIVISDKTPSAVTLIRTKNGWEMGSGEPVRTDAVNTLLSTLHRMRMRNFIPANRQSMVEKRMSVYGKHVKVYQNGELVKDFMVGTESEDQMATYMMLNEADAPYAVHIPGFNGFLSTRFITKPHLWRSLDVTSLEPEDIREVRMKYPDSTDASFKLEVVSQEKIRLSNLSTGKVIDNVDMTKAKLYLGAVSQMSIEGPIIPSDPIYARRDSLLASTPVFEMEVESKNGEVINLQGYRIKGPAESFDPDREAPEYDPDRMHGFINEEEMVLIQYYGLRHVLQPLRYFR